MVAGAEVVTAGLGGGRRGWRVWYGLEWTDRKNTVSAHSQRLWMDEGGGRDRAAISLLYLGLFAACPCQRRVWDPTSMGGIGEAGSQCGSEYYMESWEGARPKNLS